MVKLHCCKSFFKKNLYLFTLLIIIITVFFFTLIERKLLGISNYRLSVNSFILKSFFHSIRDFLKLVLKKNNFRFFNNVILKLNIFIMMFFFVEYLSIVVSIYEWNILDLNIIIFFILFSFSIYVFIFINWRSISIFRKITFFRLIVQIIRYECIFSFLFLILIISSKKFSFYYNNFFIFLPFFFSMIILTGIIEARRQPFDFIECESELISGFNLEYYSFLFSLIILFEYSIILLFINNLVNIKLTNFFTIWLLFLRVRLFLSRSRYDIIIYLFWKEILFLVIFIIFYLNIII